MQKSEKTKKSKHKINLSGFCFKDKMSLQKPLTDFQKRLKWNSRCTFCDCTRMRVDAS